MGVKSFLESFRRHHLASTCCPSFEAVTEAVTAAERMPQTLDALVAAAAAIDVATAALVVRLQEQLEVRLTVAVVEPRL